MLGPKQQKWVDALRSGKYPQTYGYLHDEHGYCCLGVADEVLGLKTENKTCLEGTFQEIGLNCHSGSFILDNTRCYLTDVNDDGATFEQIADFIEANPNLVFKRVV